jgi:hypothetical protein
MLALETTSFIGSGLVIVKSRLIYVRIHTANDNYQFFKTNATHTIYPSFQKVSMIETC